MSREQVFQLFKYTVYVFLSMNVYWFFIEEYSAARLQFPHGVPPVDLIEAFAATIDTVAWIVLLLMFELETYVLDDRHFTPTVTRTLQSVRFFSYFFIVYAFYGYVINLTFLDAVAPLAGITNLCSLATGEWSYAVDLDQYIAITVDNCNSLSSASAFVRFLELPAVVDADGLEALVGLAWIDVINAGVWLLIVVVLEIDVRLQEHNRYEGVALYTSNTSKVILYATLLYAAAYWGINGDFVDFWDAFLWLVAFVFIELNVIEWHRESTGASTGAIA
jgi:hypothetical protein